MAEFAGTVVLVYLAGVALGLFARLMWPRG